ncbi:MAG: STAS domain-containing protein [Bacteroidota bacterium]
MIDVQKFNEKDYLVKITGTNKLDTAITTSLNNELVHYMKEDASIVIDLENIEGVDREGYRNLVNLMDYAGKNNCFIKFTAVQDGVTELINNLSYTSDG